MQDQYQVIGETAGKIYRCLEQNGAETMSSLGKAIGEKESVLLNQALGWLAREGKIQFHKNGAQAQISIAPGECATVCR